MTRKASAEFLGTALLVFFGVGAATLSFGFGATGTSFSAGVVATALTFGLVLMALAYSLGPISGCHVNPAVTLGVLCRWPAEPERCNRVLDRSVRRRDRGRAWSCGRRSALHRCTTARLRVSEPTAGGPPATST